MYKIPSDASQKMQKMTAANPQKMTRLLHTAVTEKTLGESREVFQHWPLLSYAVRGEGEFSPDMSLLGGLWNVLTQHKHIALEG